MPQRFFASHVSLKGTVILKVLFGLFNRPSDIIRWCDSHNQPQITSDRTIHEKLHVEKNRMLKKIKNLCEQNSAEFQR